MKDYILDTHTLLWMQDDSSFLSKKAREILADNDNNLFVSIVSFWEIAIKHSLNKLELNYNLETLENACQQTGVVILPIDIKSLKVLKKLPFIHRDPFDRLIIATTINSGYKLISKDLQIKNYEINVIW